MALPLFDCIDALFDREKWNSISAIDKRANFFMIHRFLSIKYVDQVSAMNLVNISKEKVLDFWNLYLTQKYTKKPFWMFTKSNPSKLKKEKDIFDKIKPTTIEYYLQKYMIDPRDFETLKQIFPQELLADLKVIQDNL